MKKRINKTQIYLKASLTGRKTIAKNFGRKMEQCFKCHKWVLFQYQENGDSRFKNCPLCLWSRKLNVFSCEFENRSGETFRKRPGQEWRRVELIEVKDGLLLADVDSHYRQPVLI